MEKPTMKQRLDSLATFIWDSENGKVLGRGGRSWAEIGLFYLVYYACLASFFAATLAVFYQTVSDTEPKLQSDSSLLNGNPGMGFRPRVDLEDAKVKATPEVNKNKKYKADLDGFLAQYKKKDLATVNCQGVNEPRKGEETACQVDVGSLTSECSEASEYGFASGTPCVLIKLNRIYGWIPKLWKTVDDSGFPKALKHSSYDSSVLPIRCAAKDSDDNDKIGTLEYYPTQGFPVHYFPYEKQQDYLSPLVFVKFANATRGKTIEMECRAYAKNIEYDRTEMQGSIQFKIYIAED